MTRPSRAALLTLWEEAADLPPARRVFRLLALVSGGPEVAAALPVGEGDRRLLALRRELFGDRVEGYADCPSCGERVEIGFAAGDLAGCVEDARPVTADGHVVRWRLPTWADLNDLADEPDPDRLRWRLLERCILDVHSGPKMVAPAERPEAVEHAVCAAMAAADPLGDIRLAVACPNCRATWEPAFDVGGYLWRELDTWARRLLNEVHTLAAAYGWHEADILALSDRRRRTYLEVVDR